MKQIHDLALTRQLEQVMDAARKAQTLLGLRDDEIKAYSVQRAFESAFSRHAGHRATGFEAEVSNELSRDMSTYDGGTVIPWWALTRGLTVGNPASAGHLVGTRPEIGSMVLALRGRSVVAAMPIESLPGCTTHFTIPVETVGPTVSAQAGEETSVPESTSTSLSSLPMVPKTLISTVKASRQFLLATGPAGDAYARSSLLNAVGEKFDLLAMAGDGTEGNPWGLVNQVTASIAGTDFDHEDVRGFQTSIGKALGPDCAFAADQATASLLNGRQRFEDSDRVLWEGTVYDGELGGWPARSSHSIPTGYLLFGAWRNVVVAEWGAGVEIAVNPYTAADFARGAIQFRAMTSFDIGLKRPTAFKKATAVT